MEINFHKTHITDDEINSVVESLKSGWTTMGPKTIEFERKFSEFMINKYSSPIIYNTEYLQAISLNSATAALHLSLKVIGLNAEDEVILPTNTFIATAEVVTYFNATPVLCDIEYKTHNIDVSKIESLITNKTKAIIPVHFAGQPCDMDEIFALARKYNLKVIEDAAHALPSYYKDTIIGALNSDVTCFSFYATKTLATGEGGMAVTKNAEYAQKIRVNRLHGISKNVWDRYSTKGNWYYEVIDNGNKYNMTDMNASLGVVQLSKLEWMCEKRKKYLINIDKAFIKNENISILQLKNDRKTSYHLYVIKVKNRDAIIEKLNSQGIGVSVHFIPVHKHPYYKDTYKYNNNDYPVSNKVFDESISLPIYPDLTDEEVEYVISSILKYVNN